MWKLNFLFFGIPVIVGMAGYKIWRRKYTLKFNLIDLAFLTLLVQQTISWWFSTYQPNSFVYLSHSILMVFYYFCLRFYQINRGYRKFSLLYLMTGLGLILGTATIFSFLFFHFNITYHGFDDIVNFRNLYHPVGMLSNDWVSYLLLFLTFAVASLFYTGRKDVKFLSGITVVLLMLGLIVSFSRGGYLSLIFFLILLSISLLVLRFPGQLIKIGIPVVIAVLLSFSFYNEISTTLGMTQNTSQIRSIEGRKKLWESAFDMFVQSPVLGVGSGNNIKECNFYIHKDPDTFFTGRVTNSFFQLLSEQGIIGVLTWGGLIAIIVFAFFTIIKKKAKSPKEQIVATTLLSGLLALGLREMTFSSFFENIGLQLGLSIIAAFAANGCRQSVIIQNRKFSNYIILLFLVLTVMGAWYFFKTSTAKKYNEQFITAFQSGNYQEAKNAINKAISWQPDNALLYFNRALLADSILSMFSFSEYPVSSNEQLLLRPPIRDLKKAIELSPADAMLFHNIAILYWASGRIEKAQDAFNSAITLEPYSTIFNFSLAQFYDWQKNENKSKFFFKRAAFQQPMLLHNKLNKHFKLEKDDDFQKVIKQSTESSVIQARKAALLLQSGDTIEAREILKEVTGKLPNLNRPWYFLAESALAKGDTTLFLSAVQRSLLLDRNDILPNIKMAEWHAAKGNHRDAITYYLRSLINYQYMGTPYFRKALKYYGSKTIVNNVLPISLLIDFNSYVELSSILSKIEGLYRLTKNIEKGNEIKKYRSGQQNLAETLQNLQKR
jgi:O-antigen ligase/Tfp pilus assembly protein PilF